MRSDDPKRRRRAGVIAAVCGGCAASSISLSAAGRHAVDQGAHGLVWQDVGLAVGIGLILVALIACVFAARRCRFR